MLAPLLRLDSRRALVTGAARGIGRAAAEALAEFGADVAVHDLDVQSCQPVVEVLRAFGGRAVAIGEPLGPAGAGGRVLQAAESALGPLDILVSTVAIQKRIAYDAIPLDEFDRTVAVNLRSFLELIQGVAPAMAKRGWGRIVTIGSVQQLRPHPEMLIYAATKSAQENMVRNLARQLAGAGVTVNNIAPGAVDTERNLDVMSDPVQLAKITAIVPMRSVAQPIDMAGAVLLLCSEAGRYMTGVDLLVDGGLSLG